MLALLSMEVAVAIIHEFHEESLAFFERLVGVEWMGSGAITSDVLLRVLHGARGGKRIIRTEHPPMALMPNLVLSFAWVSPDIGRHRTLWHYDVNGAYLSAASSLALPRGKPCRTPIWEDYAAGYWLERDAGWVTTPTLAHIAEWRRPEVTDGWGWEETARPLEPWYRRLRAAREALIEDDGPHAADALAMVKRTYAEGVGRLGSPLRTHPESPLYQPSWRHHVIATANARMLRAIGFPANFASEPSRATPEWIGGGWISRGVVAIDADSVWMPERPANVDHTEGLTLSPKLGKWKWAGTAEPPPGGWDAQTGARHVLRTLRERETAK